MANARGGNHGYKRGLPLVEEAPLMCDLHWAVLLLIVMIVTGSSVFLAAALVLSKWRDEP